jgi:type IV secretory pathway VirB10-like protein
VVGASSELAALPGTALMQRYETRLQNMYARAIRTFKVLKTIPVPDQDDDIPDQDAPPIIELPKEPSPISEQPSQTPQPSDSSGAANPGCSRLSGGSSLPPTETPTPAKPQAPQPAPPGRAKHSGGAV